MVKTNARVDPDLKKETGFNTELEWRGTFRNCLYVDLSLFYLRCKDRIGSVFTTDSRFTTYRLRTSVSDSRKPGPGSVAGRQYYECPHTGKSKYELQ